MSRPGRAGARFNRVGPAAQDFEDYRVLGTFANEAEEDSSGGAPGGPEADRPSFFTSR